VTCITDLLTHVKQAIEWRCDLNVDKTLDDNNYCIVVYFFKTSEIYKNNRKAQSHCN